MSPRPGARRQPTGDDGSALAIALVFLMLFGVYVGVVLQFALTGQRTTTLVREEAATTYAGAGALDGAINSVRASLASGLDPGTTPIPASTCFTLPAGALDAGSAVTVTCRPRTGSGVGGAASASQPAQAVLGLSANAAEGVSLAAASALTVQGSVAARSSLSVPAGASLTSTGAVTAGSCLVLGTSSPACAVAAAPGDPGWAGPASYPSVVGSLPACATPVVTLQPGTYRSAAALQAVLSCGSTVVWFKPGTYYFDFQDAGTHEVQVGAGSVVVGGTPSGWVPGTTSPGSVPSPTAAAPAASACDQTAPGVDFVFGADSRLYQSGGKLQLCALDTSSTNQHLVLQGLAATASLPGTGSSGATAATDLRPAGSRAWDTPAEGAVVDGAVAHVKVPNTASTPSRLLVGPFSSSVVPGDASGITVTVTATETVGGTGVVSAVGRPGDGSAATPPVTLHNCPSTSACGASAFVPGQTDTTTLSGLTPAQVNGLSVEVVVSNPNNSPVDAWVDGVTVTVSFTAPMRATSGTGAATPYVTGSAATTAVLRASGAGTVTALHGTVYAPMATVDLSATAVPATVVDRGLVVRHLWSAMTRAAGFTGPLISVPATAQSPRRVLMTALDGSGQVIGRADVSFSDAAGTGNGTIPAVREWWVG